MKYKEYKNIDYVEVADNILNFWEEKDIFKKSITSREGKPQFTFYEGPPSANGAPGIHHVISRSIKDIFCRYKTLAGYQVKRKGGWDTHGLPVELQVEKELGITKEDIGKNISVEEYNRKCREAVMKYKDQWDSLTQKMGYWVDLDHPYITFKKDYMESLWHLLKRFYEKGLLYKGYSIQPYSPAAGTGLSSHELNQPGTYKDVKDTSVIAQFKSRNNPDEFFLAWTTTPWTLAANSALAVGKNIIYLKVKTFNAYTHEPVTVILAKDRFSTYFDEKARDIELEDYEKGEKFIPYKIISEHKGSEFIGFEYEQLLPYVKPNGPAFQIIEGDFVSTEDGTGIVHISPTFGADDLRVAQKAGIGSVMVKDSEGKEVPIVDKQGRYVDEITDFAGIFVKNEYYRSGEEAELSLDVQISIKLKKENKAFKVEKYVHSYPHCWRTDKPVLYYPLESWFIKTTEYKDRLVELNKTINWKPESTGQKRFGNWLENLVDWNLSRSRFWGTPLPIWVSEDKKEEKCIGSVQELKDEIDKSINSGHMQKNPALADDFDLHRPFVDEIILASDTGQKMFREPALIDVWFDSGAMPYAQWHYPFENKEIFIESYPADFIAEGVDQTRGWFFTLHAISVMLFDKVSFKTVMANGLVMDKKGNKMSKRLGNAIDPFETLEKYGPDATRWYMIVNANPWDNMKFDLDGVAEVQRRFFGTLQNTYSFFALYANLDQFTFQEDSILLEHRTESDRWVISKLNSLIRLTENAYKEYEPTKAARLIQNFVIDDLSNWYVRLNRKRFWRGEYNTDKIAAYQTLYTCLKTISKLASPIAPLYTDRLFLDLNAVSCNEDCESVHLSSYPEVDESSIDNELEIKMALAQNISSLVHSLRKKHMIKVRQPLSKIMIPVLNSQFKEHVQAMEPLILSEVNIKKIEYIDDTGDILVKKIKPNFRKLGSVYGSKMKEISSALSRFTQDDILQIERNDSYSLELNGETIELKREDVEITSQDIPGWSVASQDHITVALDIKIDSELKQEGIARDLVNRIQNLRKDMGLEVQDKIRISVKENEKLVNQALQNNKEYICTETQALSLDLTDNLSEGTEVEMDDVKLLIKIEV